MNGFHGKKSGPWLWHGPLPDGRQQIGGRRFAIGLVRSYHGGILIRFASPTIGSWIVGWYPSHRRCTAQPPVHHCLSYALPEFEIGLKPGRELAKVG